MSRVFDDLSAVRNACPLVHNITNFVVMNNTANALLALGASPIMAHAPEEMDEMAALCHALVLNIGTLSTPWIESMLLAGLAAKQRGIPVILDPVGAGATTLRTDTARRIMQEIQPHALRGNASEILALAGALHAVDNQRLAVASAASGGGTRGVDSTHASGGIEDVAQALAENQNCVVVVSGETDLVADAKHTCKIKGGDPLMTKVTGLGCTASALVAAFAAVIDDTFQAATSAMAVMKTAGALAAAKAQGPGTLQLHFYDTLHNMTEPDLDMYATMA